MHSRKNALNKYIPRKLSKQLKFLFSVILSQRRDLVSVYTKKEKLNYAGFLYWVIVNGLKEYTILRESAPLSIFLFSQFEDNAFNMLTHAEYIIWCNRSDLQDAFPIESATRDYKIWCDSFFEKEYGANLSPLRDTYDKVCFFPTTRKTALSFAGKSNFRSDKIHVNLIGYPCAEFGIGEDLRMAAAAFEKKNIDFTILAFDPKNGIQNKDMSFSKYIRDFGVGSISIFYMTAPEMGRYLLEKGTNTTLSNYNIGSWPWELEDWPDQWDVYLKLVDEIWVNSEFQKKALMGKFCGEIFVMPPSVYPTTNYSSQARSDVRNSYGIDSESVVFFYIFDVNSSIHRKNPQGLVEAFQKAFDSNVFMKSDVRLVIKTHALESTNKKWQALKRAMKSDARIILIEDTMSKVQLHSLYAAFDCFVSLHRAEGFGRNIAEALQAGCYVIATGYGGNMDFCKLSLFDEKIRLVNYSTVRISRGQYEYGEGQVWANPDVLHASKLMKEIYLKSKMETAPRADPICSFSTKRAGQNYASRIMDINKIISDRSGLCNLTKMLD